MIGEFTFDVKPAGMSCTLVGQMRLTRRASGSRARQEGHPQANFGLVVRRRLEELGREQKDLAAACAVTESYISQLLARKKAPPAPDRTDIYPRMARFLKVPAERLARLADLQRKEELRRHLTEPPTPLLKEVRELVLRKCAPGVRAQVRVIFEKDPFGPLERLVTQKILDVVKGIAQGELQSESWLRQVAQVSGRSYEDLRVVVLEFLDTDVLSLSVEDCETFLDPLIQSWQIDLATFAMDVVLNRQLAQERSKTFEFVETAATTGPAEEPGLKAFLADPMLGGDLSPDEVAFLSGLRLNGRRPNPLYYYRELQNLRDPLHFRPRPDRAPRRGAARAGRGSVKRSRSDAVRR
jgi:transcriptional regulator with XRE-family HTH domain